MTSRRTQHPLSEFRCPVRTPTATRSMTGRQRARSANRRPRDWRPAPPRRAQFIPWQRENRSGQQPRLGGSGASGPQPRFTPGTQPAEGERVPGPGGYAPSVAPQPPATPWLPPPSDLSRPPAIDRPRQAQAIEHPSPAWAIGPPRPERAIIGDEIRIPIVWCEFGECIHGTRTPRRWASATCADGRTRPAGATTRSGGSPVPPACSASPGGRSAARLSPRRRKRARPRSGRPARSLRMMKSGGN